MKIDTKKLADQLEDFGSTGLGGFLLGYFGLSSFQPGEIEAALDIAKTINPGPLMIGVTLFFLLWRHKRQ